MIAARTLIAGGGHFLTMGLAALPNAMVRIIGTVYLVADLKLDPLIAGSYVYGATLLGIFITYYAGRGFLDRHEPAYTVAAALCFTVLNVVLLTLAAQSVYFLIAAALCAAFSQLLMPSLFVYDERRRPQGADTGGIYATRTLISLVWIVAPPVTFSLYWYGAFSAVASVIFATVTISAAAMLYAARRAARPVGGPVTDEAMTAAAPVRDATARFRASIVFAVLVGVTSTNVLHAMSMPLYLLNELNVEAFWLGITMVAGSGTEVLVIALIPRLLRWTNEETVLVTGVVFGLVYFALLFLADSIVAITLIQIVYGAHFALSTVVCIGILNKGGRKLGAAAAHFLNAGKIGGLVGALLFALLATPLGFGGLVKLVAPALVALALVGALVVRYRRNRGPAA